VAILEGVMTKYLVHDIETIPETELKADWEADAEKQRAKGVADPFPGIPYHKVICIGMLTLDRDLKPVKSGCAEDGVAGGKSEKEMIEKWNKVAWGGGGGGTGTQLRLVDWHGRGFDVPVLQTRAFRYGIQLPWYFGKLPDNRGEVSSFSKEYRDRYGGWHEDLAEYWTNRGAFPRPQMASLAKLIGLPGKAGVDGSKVYDLWKDHHRHLGYATEDGSHHVRDGRMTEAELLVAQAKHREVAQEIAKQIDTYCMQDVFQTAFIMQRARHIAGELGLGAYREAARALYDHIAAIPYQADFVKAVDLPSLLLES
jgi:predicted PolB exonuclease-like 3'-5' exonuclease